MNRQTQGDKRARALLLKPPRKPSRQSAAFVISPALPRRPDQLRLRKCGIRMTMTYGE